jgi:hypothetical protein
MEFIVKGRVPNYPQPIIKRILAIGPGESTADLFSRPFELAPDVITIGLHNVFNLLNSLNIKLDYWTWADPNGSINGLGIYNSLKTDFRPKIIIPYWMQNLNLYTQNIGTSPLTRGPEPPKNLYHRTLKQCEIDQDVILITNAIPVNKLPKNHDIFVNPINRFNKKNVIIGTDPFNMPKKGEPYENALTSVVLPICHYLGADEVCCIGFDNMGLGIGDRKVGQEVRFNNVIKEKTKLWTDTWLPYHKMKIYNLSPPKYSPNHTFMETVSIDSILKK